MDEMTRLLVGHHAWNGFGRRHELALAEILGEIAHPIAESLRALGVDRIVLQQVTIFLESSAAASGRDDDRVVAAPRERVDILTGQDARLLHHASVNMERAATLLLDR